jgi:hypothetical protein
MWAGVKPSEFSAWITRERSMKPHGLDLIERGGGRCPYLIQWRGTCPGWRSPPSGDPGSTKILTRHFSAQSQTVSQLVSSRTMPSSKSSYLSPSGFTTHLRMGSVQILHLILTTQMEPWAFLSCQCHTYQYIRNLASA